MALTSLPEVEESLALQHAQDQEEVAAQLALGLLPMWYMLNPDDLEGTTLAWLIAVMPLIQKAFEQSQHLTGVFINDYRAAALATADPLNIELPDVERPLDVPVSHWDTLDFDGPLIPFEPFDHDEVSRNMVVNGPSRVMAGMDQKTLEEAMTTGLHTSSGAAIRQAVNGSRSVTRTVADKDPRILGYARVTDGNPCYYCAILASRGAVYKDDSFVASDAQFDGPDMSDLGDNWSDVAKVHDNCRCTLRPVYAKAHFRDRDSWFYYEQWKEFSKGKSNAKAIREYRKRFVRYPREDAKIVNLADIRNRRNSLIQAGFNEDSDQVLMAERLERRLAA
jgi:hypothetical protein